MTRSYFSNLRRFAYGTWHIFRPVLRQVAGWMFIILGLLGLVLPVMQGVLFLVIGVALVGPRNIIIRRARVALKRFLRRWAALPVPVIGRLGGVALRGQQVFSRRLRHAQTRWAAWWQRRFPRAAAASRHAMRAERYECAPQRIRTE